MSIRKAIGQNIRRLRSLKNWSQEKLSIRSKISHNYLSRLERGEVNVSVDSLEKIAKCLKVEVEDLVKKQ
jgi:transcriptional regulator with XRE-family HTH domain